jgi:Ca2+-transporting ATPase
VCHRADYKDPSREGTPTWLYMLVVSVSLAVSAVPEGLPLIVTICLCFVSAALAVSSLVFVSSGLRALTRRAWQGAQRLAARKTLVVKLSAVEALGAASVICSDKTGTLTEGPPSYPAHAHRCSRVVQEAADAAAAAGKMTAVKLWVDGSVIDVSGKGFSPVGRFTHHGNAVTGATGVFCGLCALLAGLATDGAHRRTDSHTWRRRRAHARAARRGAAGFGRRAGAQAGR